MSFTIMDDIYPEPKAQPQASLYPSSQQTAKERASTLASALANMFSAVPIHTKMYLPVDSAVHPKEKEEKNG